MKQEKMVMMIKNTALCLIGSLFISGLGSASSENDLRDGPNDNPLYKELVWDYEQVANSNLPQSEKAKKAQEIAEKMRKLTGNQNENYNDCMRESNKQQRSDYNRCDKNGGKDKCYDRADKNAESRKNSCERVAHSDNVKDTVNKD